jgi:hypothetical protein
MAQGDFAMSYDSDAHLSLDSRKMRTIFDAESSEEGARRERNRDLVDEYAAGFRRMKAMRMDENFWQE